ncbi:MAG: hypothetical protein IH866_00010 [Chloroflexi bacterium]|nr:hypothetical protein [Chloroflexota bacterium]
MTDLTTQPSYPLRLEVDYPERLSRMRALIKAYLVIPDMMYLARIFLKA